MKGVRCLGLLIFSITCSLFLSPSLGVSALKHDYQGVPFLTQQVPSTYYEDEDGLYHLDWTNSTRGFSSNVGFDGFGGFSLRGYGSDYSDLNWSQNMSYISLNYSDNYCTYDHFYALGGISSDSSGYSFSVGQDFYNNNLQINSSFPIHCQFHKEFGDSPEPPILTSSFPTTGMISASSDNGFIAGQMSPYQAFALFNNYWYTFDGFYTHSTAIDTSSGVHYNHSFSFSDMLNKEIHDVSQMTLPLWSYDDYWTDPSNFYQGRDLKWVGVFDFDQPVTVTQNMPSTSYFYVNILGVDQSLQGFSQQIPCVLNYRSLQDTSVYRLEYTCQGILSADLVYAFPSLELENPDGNVFSTTGDWRWNTQYLVTDNDETPGQSFGGLTSGLGQVSDISDSTPDWFQSLLNLFSFGFFNPFAPIFQLFTDNSNCVEIPTIAGMLHAEETTVCPWFDSSVRAIVTPVLGLSSMMLVFGFAVRWLGGGSGNMLEDTIESNSDWRNFDPAGPGPGSTVIGRYRRKH